MHRTQIQLTDEQLAALRALSAAKHRSVADLVRESVDRFVEQASPDRDELMKRAIEAAGQFSSGLTDVSERHDDYLAEDFL
jgi:predicted DNA-binding protein